MDIDDKIGGLGAVVLFVVVVAAGVYYYNRAAPAAAPAVPAASAPVPAPAASPAEPLPKLEESDAFIRSKAAALSADPLFAAWLKTDDLLERFAAAANMIGHGRVPKDALSFLAPRRKFSVRKKDGKFYEDAAAYARYDAAARAFGSLDAAAAAGFFGTCRPLFQEAYRGLGEEKGDVRDAVARAVQELLKTPLVAGGMPLKEKGLGYAYADDALEKMSPARKQLLRMGPKNQAAIQAKLREFDSALNVVVPGTAK
ncbi:MAG: DUF3014 domain-containing protein [Elusimicrobiota bacterium]